MWPFKAKAKEVGQCLICRDETAIYRTVCYKPFCEEEGTRLAYRGFAYFVSQHPPALGGEQYPMDPPDREWFDLGRVHYELWLESGGREPW